MQLCSVVLLVLAVVWSVSTRLPSIVPLASGATVGLYIEHGGLPFASTANGSLELRADAKGLHVSATPLDTTAGRDAKVLIASGVMNEMSFGFIPKADRMDQVQGRQVRTILDLDIFDVSIVTKGAYSNTAVSLRSLEEFPAMSAREQAARIRFGLITRKGESNV